MELANFFSHLYKNSIKMFCCRMKKKSYQYVRMCTCRELFKPFFIQLYECAHILNYLTTLSCFQHITMTMIKIILHASCNFFAFAFQIHEQKQSFMLFILYRQSERELQTNTSDEIFIKYIQIK